MLDSAIGRYIPIQKQRKLSPNKHTSKEAFRKNKYEKVMWQILYVYNYTGNDKDYTKFTDIH